MTRPVYIAKTALLCARGNSPTAVASALWDGESIPGPSKLGERAFPSFGFALEETHWVLCVHSTVSQVTDQPLVVFPQSL